MAVEHDMLVALADVQAWLLIVMARARTHSGVRIAAETGDDLIGGRVAFSHRRLHGHRLRI